MAKTYYEENKEKRHDYYEENRERRQAYGRKRYQEKKSDCQAASKKYRKKHAKKAACDHEAECPDNPYKKKIAELTEALKAASPPPSREAREAKIVFVIICTDSSGGELSDSVVAVAGTKHHAIAYIDLQPEDFQKTYDIEEYTVIQ